MTVSGNSTRGCRVDHGLPEAAKTTSLTPFGEETCCHGYLQSFADGHGLGVDSTSAAELSRFGIGGIIVSNFAIYIPSDVLDEVVREQLACAGSYAYVNSRAYLLSRFVPIVSSGVCLSSPGASLSRRLAQRL